jgi:hypothetical protein
MKVREARDLKGFRVKVELESNRGPFTVLYKNISLADQDCVALQPPAKLPTDARCAGRHAALISQPEFYAFRMGWKSANAAPCGSATIASRPTFSIVKGSR